MPGPLPEPNARRRPAQPTIPTTALPAAGFDGKAPRIPKSYELAEAGKAWWRWAWKTPQAAAWSPGDTYAIARRASLEDELAAIGAVPEINVADLLGDAMLADLEDQDEVRKLGEAFEWLISSLQKAAGPANAVRREMRELDDRFGLTPKGMAQLRWKIVATEAKEDESKGKAKPGAAARAAAMGIFAVDPAAATDDA
ncbi:MAG: hypothetical protein PGN13_16265 [Patulibacter minatonensis]